MSDFISRQDVLDILRNLAFDHMFQCGEYYGEDERQLTIINARKAIDVIEAMPSVEQEREKGQWIIRYFDMETYKYKEKAYNYYEKMPEGDVYCSECKESALLNGHEESVFSNFCPYCGADMRMRGEE